MGRFFTESDLPKRKHDHDHTYCDMDWFVGDIDRFKYIFRWYYDDYTFQKTTSSIPRIEIRKWFEDRCSGDLLVVNGSYHTKIREARWDSSGTMPTYFVDFKFDTLDDALLFKLTWCDIANGSLEEININKH